MPAATTHVEFAKDVFAQLPDEFRNRITNRQMFWLGSQGPDLLFFSRGSVMPGSLKKYGDLMHVAKIYEVISYFDSHIGNDSDLYSYVCGYLCHYALDSKVHPLVEAMAKDAHEKTGVHKSAQHITYEANIDVWILNQRGRGIQSYDVDKYLKIDRVSRKKLAQLYHGMLETVFGVNVSVPNLQVAIAEVSVWNRFLYPSRSKNSFLVGFEHLFHLPAVISGIVLYDKHDLSIINLEHKTYPLEYDASLSISESFPELYGQAITLAKKLLESHEESDFDRNFLGIPKSYANQKTA